MAAALARGDEAAVLRLLTDLTGLERRANESIDALLTDLAFVLRLAPTPLSADAQLILPSGTCASRDLLMLLETLLERQREPLVADRALPLFPLLFDWFYWFRNPPANARVERPASRHHPHYERWVEAERLSRAAPPGAPSPELWLRRLLLWRPAIRCEPASAFRARCARAVATSATCWSRAACRSTAHRGVDARRRDHDRADAHRGVSRRPRLALRARSHRAHRRAAACSSAHSSAALRRSQPRAAHRHRERRAGGGRSVERGTLGASGPGPLRQLLPLDHGPTILHHPSGSRLFNLTQATPIGLVGPVPSSVTFTEGAKKRIYNLSRDATRELRLVDGDSGRVLLGLVLAARMQIEAPSTNLSPDGTRLLVWNRGRAQLWSTETLAPIAALPAFGDSINTSISAVELTNDSELVFIANGNTLYWFAASDATPRGALRFAGSDGKPDENLDYVHLARAGTRAVLLYAGSAWHFVDPAIGTLGPAMAIGYHHPPVVAPDGTFVVLFGSKSIQVHSLPDGTLRFEVETYSHDVGISTDSATIELRYERRLQRFDARTGEKLDLNVAPPVERPASRIDSKEGRDRVRIDTGALTTPVRLHVVPEPRLPNTRVRFLGGDGGHLLTEHESGLQALGPRDGARRARLDGRARRAHARAHGQSANSLVNPSRRRAGPTGVDGRR